MHTKGLWMLVKNGTNYTTYFPLYVFNRENNQMQMLFACYDHLAPLHNPVSSHRFTH